jgi:hypothetical protein
MEPFLAKFINEGPVAMRLVPRVGFTKDMGAVEAVVEPGASVSMQVRLACLVDWQIASTNELVYRTVVEKFGHKRHLYREQGYTGLCQDATPKSPAVRNATFFDALDGRSLEIRVLSEDPFVAFIPEWTAGDECAEMESQALKIGLSGAQVFGKKGLMADRRAQSANLYWDKSNDSAVTNRLINRAFEFTKAMRPYPIVAGAFQEPLNFIQYGLGDEYRPHCDGACGGGGGAR